MEQIIARLVKDFEDGKLSRRQLIKSLALTATAAAGASAAPAAPDFSKGFKALAVNHISYQAVDYARARDWYVSMFNMTVPFDTGDQCYLQFGDPDSKAGETTIHMRRTNRADNKAYIDHMAYTIDNWDRDAVYEELKRRGYDPKADSKYGWTIKDSEGFGCQLIAKEHNRYLLYSCGGYMQGCPKK
jgi:Glyoxalase/Bleomycin resistance protein/Dioxygenase superfamily